MEQNIDISLLENNEGQIEGIKPNPRSINESDFIKLKQSIKDYPDMLELRELLVVPHNDKYVVIGGNQRLRALRDLDYDTAPCKIIPPHVTHDTINAIIIKDNTQFGEFDWDMLANAWDYDDLIEWGVDLPNDWYIEDEVESQINTENQDDIPEVKENPITKLGDVWILGDHRLMCGDSTVVTDVEKLMNGKKADMVFTDPPYGISVDTNTSTNTKSGNGVTKRNKFGKILNDDNTKCANDFYNLAMNYFTNATLVLWGANYYDFLPPSKCWISWYKKDDLPSDSFCDTELAYTNSDKHTKTICVQWRGMIKEGEMGISRVHPTQKPVLLSVKSLEYLEAGKYIFDGFAGSGSTLIACENTKRISYNMELSPVYCDVIIRRWQKYTNKKAILESTQQTFDELAIE